MLKRLIAQAMLLFFIGNSFSMPSAYADPGLVLPAPGQMVPLSEPYNPAVLKGIKLDPNNPFRFHFYVDQGDDVKGVIASDSTASAGGGPGFGGKQSFKDESAKLIKYFLTSLTIPEQDLWVNLSPYEKDRIIPNEFGQTAMGRDLLAQDYLLKQITASLIYPESELGKKFWDKIYKQAQAKFGTTNIPINTFNKVWIVPEKAVVYENNGTAFVLENHLKVMLEEDYLATQKNLNDVSLRGISRSNLSNLKIATSATPPRDDTSIITSQIIREIIIPALTKEVNEGKNFAQLRQVFYSLILATWYKKKIKDSVVNKVYSNQKKISNLSSPKSSIGDPERIYGQYLQAFKKGVFNYIKEDSMLFPGPLGNAVTLRKYFSGGVNAYAISIVTTIIGPKQLKHSQVVKIDLAQIIELTVDSKLIKPVIRANKNKISAKVEDRAMVEVTTKLNWHVHTSTAQALSSILQTAGLDFGDDLKIEYSLKEDKNYYSFDSAGLLENAPNLILGSTIKLNLTSRKIPEHILRIIAYYLKEVVPLYQEEGARMPLKGIVKLLEGCNERLLQALRKADFDYRHYNRAPNYQFWSNPFDFEDHAMTVSEMIQLIFSSDSWKEEEEYKRTQWSFSKWAEFISSEKIGTGDNILAIGLGSKIDSLMVAALSGANSVYVDRGDFFNNPTRVPDTIKAREVHYPKEFLEAGVNKRIDYAYDRQSVESVDFEGRKFNIVFAWGMFDQPDVFNNKMKLVQAIANATTNEATLYLSFLIGRLSWNGKDIINELIDSFRSIGINAVHDENASDYENAEGSMNYSLSIDETKPKRRIYKLKLKKIKETDGVSSTFVKPNSVFDHGMEAKQVSTKLLGLWDQTIEPLWGETLNPALFFELFKYGTQIAVQKYGPTIKLGNEVPGEEDNPTNIVNGIVYRAFLNFVEKNHLKEWEEQKGLLTEYLRRRNDPEWNRSSKLLLNAEEEKQLSDLSALIVKVEQMAWFETSVYAIAHDLPTVNPNPFIQPLYELTFAANVNHSQEMETFDKSIKKLLTIDKLHQRLWLESTLRENGIISASDSSKLTITIVPDNKIPVAFRFNGSHLDIQYSVFMDFMTRGDVDGLIQGLLGNERNISWFKRGDSNVLKLRKILVDNNAWISRVQLLDQGKRVLYYDENEGLQVMDVESQKIIASIDVRSVFAVSPDEKWLVYFNKGWLVRINLDGLLQGDLDVHEERILEIPNLLRVEFSPDGKHLALSSNVQSPWESLSIRVIDVEHNKVSFEKNLVYKPQIEDNLRFLGNDKLVVSELGDIVILNVLDGNQIERYSMFDTHSPKKDAIISIATNVNAGVIAVTNAFEVKVLNLRTKAIEVLPKDSSKKFQQHVGVIFTLAFDDQGKRLISIGHDGTLRVWDVEKDNLVGINNLRLQDSVSLHVLGNHIAVSGLLGEALTLWDFNDGYDDEERMGNALKTLIENKRNLLLRLMPILKDELENFKEKLRKPLVGQPVVEVDLNKTVGEMDDLYRRTQRLLFIEFESLYSEENLTEISRISDEFNKLKQTIEFVSRNTPDNINNFRLGLLEFVGLLENFKIFDIRRKPRNATEARQIKQRILMDSDALIQAMSASLKELITRLLVDVIDVFKKEGIEGVLTPWLDEKVKVNSDYRNQSEGFVQLISPLLYLRDSLSDDDQISEEDVDKHLARLKDFKEFLDKYIADDIEGAIKAAKRKQAESDDLEGSRFFLNDAKEKLKQAFARVKEVMDSNYPKIDELLNALQQQGVQGEQRELSKDKDRAMSTTNGFIQPIQRKGGIDLNPGQMTVDLKGRDDNFKFNLNGQEIDAAQVVGMNFMITSMTPVTHMSEVLGFN